ncbi:GNAT family N-acetyltransferase [Atopomonas hussainii]|uniref:GNAT family N-acetyltransferase n=1 Tax=Atopomonas hussainii TaxID=1429083 RepID=UPI0008FFEFCC|nr:GNAT family N-acyltransferase [Atopomonas hussainii]
MQAQTQTQAVATPTRRLQFVELQTHAELREAQALRFTVFSEEYEAKLDGAELGLDCDHFDVACRHIGVRDERSGELVATTRLLDSRAAAHFGHFYSEQEFQLDGLQQLDGPILEIGRTCVAREHRNGATIAVLWAGLAEVLNSGEYRYLMGCASISMRDGGIQAHAIMQRIRGRYLCHEHLRANPRRALPALQLGENVTAELPPLLKAYLRLGAKVCGEPAWDEDFQVADVFILLKREDLCPRYARHFKAAV